MKIYFKKKKRSEAILREFNIKKKRILQIII